MFCKQHDVLVEEPRPSAARPRRSGVGDEIDALVGPAHDGDGQAVTALIRLVRPLIVRYCSHRLHGSPVSAEDVTQDTCMAIVRALPGYRDRGRPFLAFVQTVASHRIASAYAAVARSREVAVSEVPDAMTTADDPERHLLEAADADAMAALLDRLPPRQRDVLVLRVVWGLSAAETGSVIGARPEAVRLLQFRALALLRKMLSVEGSERAAVKRPPDRPRRYPPGLG
ncbi:sigma-70 family RNA polymerase sigma factor [Pseudonocardia sp.]|jgi:RNA polymerase sigma-70 factor (ECF subfamily)|uniref:sigma-70 family RNA polymerase sigma factor n=1 Tax=Pseudonocardia sp. TaxID=60912 RepID=UPI0031FCFF30